LAIGRKDKSALVLKSLHLLPGAKHPVFGKNKAGDSTAGQILKLQGKGRVK
jgi:hypothetical protein